MRLIQFIFLVGIFLGVNTVFVAAQGNLGNCENLYTSPIECGFYLEGAQDGAADAHSNRSNNYRRYSRKYTGKYRKFYSHGYEDGYKNKGDFMAWTSAERATYNNGYDLGVRDRRRSNIRKEKFNRNRTIFYRQGYMDGYDGKKRTYDVAIDDSNPNNNNYGNRPGNTSRDGSVNWRGTVDDKVNLILRRNSIRTETISGTSYGESDLRLNPGLPRSDSFVTVNKLDGRGSASVVQQPSRANGYTAIVRIEDSKSGADQYVLDISWGSTSNSNSFSGGKVIWNGRVDDRVNIEIDGSRVLSRAVTGRAVSDVSFDIAGRLPNRPNTVFVRKLDGRGDVVILEQPNRGNGYRALVQVIDKKSGDDNYELEITW